MQYFTSRLCCEINSPHSAIAARAHAACDRNAAAYETQLQPLLPRFSKRNQRFWSDYVHRLHDGAVVSAAVGDAVGLDVRKKRPRSWRTGVTIEAIDEDGFLCALKYTAIEAVDMRLREGEWYGSAGTVFDQWGYSELTAEGADAFRHSILFATGSEVSIVFRRFSFTRKRLPLA